MSQSFFIRPGSILSSLRIGWISHRVPYADRRPWVKVYADHMQTVKPGSFRSRMERLKWTRHRRCMKTYVVPSSIFINAHTNDCSRRDLRWTIRKPERPSLISNWEIHKHHRNPNARNLYIVYLDYLVSFKEIFENILPANPNKSVH